MDISSTLENVCMAHWFVFKYVESRKTYKKILSQLKRMYHFSLQLSFEIFCRCHKYLTSFALELGRNACRFSYEVSVIVTDFNQNSKTLTNFSKSSQYQISLNYFIGSRGVSYGKTDVRTDGSNLIGAAQDFKRT
jgi:hypothetical protein